MASYFSYLPNIYVGEGITDDEAYKYKLVKNIFRRVKTRADLSKYVTLTEAYSIPENTSISQLAMTLFNNPYYDWIICLINNITDVYEEWPKDNYYLQEYVQNKYAEPDGVHHYETQEVLYNDQVYIEKGNEVNASFRAELPDGTIESEVNSIYPVSNFEYEDYENEKKRLIQVPTPGIVEIIVSEFDDLVAYEPCEEVDKQGNKKTELSIAGRFLDQIGYVSGSINVTQQSQTTGAITFDDGPTSSASVGTATSTSIRTTSGTSASSSSGVAGGPETPFILTALSNAKPIAINENI